MVKKGGTTEKKERTNSSSVSSEIKVEKILVENFVSLQKVMTNLAVKFDNLSSQISNLLELFKISAKTLAEKGALMEDRKAVEKLDKLIEQNKVIARGIALMHEKGSEPQRQVIMQRPTPYQIQQAGRINPLGGYSQPPSTEFPKSQNLRK